MSAQEVAEGVVSVAEFDTAKDSEISIRTNGAPKKVFKFDSVFTPEADQGKHVSVDKCRIIELFIVRIF